MGACVLSLWVISELQLSFSTRLSHLSSCLCMFVDFKSLAIRKYYNFRKTFSWNCNNFPDDASLPQFALPWREYASSHAHRCLSVDSVTALLSNTKQLWTESESHKRASRNFKLFLKEIPTTHTHTRALRGPCWSRASCILSLPSTFLFYIRVSGSKTSYTTDCSPVITLLAKSQLQVCICKICPRVCSWTDRNENGRQATSEQLRLLGSVPEEERDPSSWWLMEPLPVLVEVIEAQL